MDLNLRDKVAIVGGASMGIGLGIASRLAAEGTRLMIFARREPALKEAAEGLQRQHGVAVEWCTADIRDRDDSSRIVQRAVERFGRLDILVNNDGAPPLGDIESFDDTAWQKAVEQNLFSVIRMVRAALPHLKAQGGSILNISAISAIQPIAGFGLSVATWSGLIGYAKTLSLELARHRINVNTICPGYIDTTRLQKVFAAGGQDPLAMRKKLEDEVPMGRIGSVEDIANMVALLVSPAGAYVTGCSIPIDGGLFRGLR
ncbi:MAG: SDR family oxidoreductase, partial [Betaproteobacteria bacterium]|nr:SDR family oxidoreductase [Betaproteobacteria bacterium]